MKVICSICCQEVEDFESESMDGDYGELSPVNTCLDCLNEEEEEEEEELTEWERRGCGSFEEYRRFVMGE